MDKNYIEIRPAQMSDLRSDALRNFNRYQVTNRVLYKGDDRLAIKDDHFVENWDEQKKKQVIEQLQRCISTGGVVAGAFVNGGLIGFASVENKFFGEKKEYLELSYMHVSCEYRGHGIGKKLFRLCCEGARKKGAQKLYMSTHPAEETQYFYKSVGCVSAVYINKEIFDKEPRDIQLEAAL